MDTGIGAHNPDPQPELVKDKTLFGDALFLPEDLVTRSTGRAAGVVVSVKIDPDDLHVINQVLQRLEKYTSAPKTKSDYGRNALMYYTRVLIQRIGILDEHPDAPILREMHAETELDRALMYARHKLTASQKQVEEIKREVGNQIAKKQYATAAAELKRFVKHIREIGRANPERGTMIFDLLKEDMGFMGSLHALSAAGHPVALPD